MFTLIRLIRFAVTNPKLGVPLLLFIFGLGFYFNVVDPAPTRAQQRASDLVSVRAEVESRSLNDCMAEAQFSPEECRCFATAVASSVSPADLVRDDAAQRADLRKRASAAMRGCVRQPGAGAAPADSPRVLVRCEVSSEPAGATLTIDGLDRGVTPTTVEVPVGRITKVTAALEGHKTATEALSPTSPHECAPLRFRLWPATAVRVTTRPPGAALTVNGVSRGPTPVVLELEARPHELVFTMPGRGTQKKTLGPDGIPSELSVDLPPVSFVLLSTTPADAEVWLDGEKVKGATTALELSSGAKHFLTVARRGYAPKVVALGAMAVGDSTETRVALGRGGSAKACIAAAKAKVKALQKKSPLEAAAWRAQEEFCAQGP